MIITLEWTDAGVRFIDQTKLPTEETYITATNYQQVADIISTMVVRGLQRLAWRRLWELPLASYSRRRKMLLACVLISIRFRR